MAKANSTRASTAARKTIIPAHDRKMVAEYRRDMKTGGRDLTDEQAYRELLKGQREAATELLGEGVVARLAAENSGKVNPLINEDPLETRDLSKNPMIGDTPRETIENVVGALQWLNSLDPFVVEAYGGEPINSITFGRHLLGKCCINALKATGHELKMFVDAQTAKAREAA